MQLSVSCHNRLFGHCGLAEEVIVVSIVVYVKRREKRCLQTGKKNNKWADAERKHLFSQKEL